jgi:hypothetical protein
MDPYRTICYAEVVPPSVRHTASRSGASFIMGQSLKAPAETESFRGVSRQDRLVLRREGWRLEVTRHPLLQYRLLFLRRYFGEEP